MKGSTSLPTKIKTYSVERVHCKRQIHLRSIAQQHHHSTGKAERACVCTYLPMQLGKVHTPSPNPTQLHAAYCSKRKQCNKVHSQLQVLNYGCTDLHPSFSPNYSCVTLLLLEETLWLLGNHWFTCSSSLFVLWQSTICFSSHPLSSMVYRKDPTIWKNLCQISRSDSCNHYH